VQLLLERAVEDGLRGAALVDRDGDLIAAAGEIDPDEAMPLAALVMYRLKAPDLGARMRTGEILMLELEQRCAAVCIAKRQLFVVVVLDKVTLERRAQISELRDRVEKEMPASLADLAASRGGGNDSGPGPDELALIELGITVPRTRGKA
jgi:hypothetical protein